MFISIILPCRNEEKFIALCLDSLLLQTYPRGKMELLVVDGASEDTTKKVINSYAIKYPFIRVFENPKKIFSAGCNVGIKNAKGDLIIIMGSHALYPKNYIERCINASLKYNADNIGGNVEPMIVRNTIINNAIIFSFGGWFGGVLRKEKFPKEVETVFGGCYKKEVFKKIGFFNENLKRTSDLEFNDRLIKAGGKIILLQDLIVPYYPKSNLKDFFIHNIEDGVWNILPSKFIKKPLKLRLYFPLIFILTLPVAIWVYLPVSFYFSAKIAFFKKNILYFFIMPLVFGAKHIGHGIGSLIGLFKLIT